MELEKLIEKMQSELKICKSVKDVYLNEDDIVVIEVIRYRGDGDKYCSNAQFHLLDRLAMHGSNATIRQLHMAVASNIINAIKNSGLERNQVRIYSY